MSSDTERMGHLRILINENFPSIQDFNAAVGFTRTSARIYSILSCNVVPSYKSAEAIATAVGTDIAFLWPQLERKKEPENLVYLNVNVYEDAKKRTGLSDATISLMLGGKSTRMIHSVKRGHRLNEEKLRKLADILGVDPSTLGTRESPRNQKKEGDTPESNDKYTYIEPFNFQYDVKFKKGAKYTFYRRARDGKDSISNRYKNLRFVGAIVHADKAPLHTKFMFRSSCGYVETFTYAQLGDYIYKEKQ